ncbi:helix-turn-helix domain-containing protein [Sorangium sp. So ce363]|uniref:helix-turn-helix domain-containing protein n=1 Tax=Sorangium sp. So ce363 TaxID=3133304 RepID=UPI003F618F85
MLAPLLPPSRSDSRDLSPRAPLRSLFSDVHVMSAVPSPPAGWTRLPSGTTSLVACWTGGEPVVAAVGPLQRATFKPSGAVPLYARLSFHPGGARPVLGVAAHELVDRVVPLDDLWGARARELRHALTRAGGDPATAVRLLEDALCRAVGARADASARRALLRRAVDALDASALAPDSDASIPALARHLRVAERTLRALFHEEIGISPKRYARIARIRRAAERLATTSLARLALETGFYDQAHLTAEFRSLLGVTPRAYLAGARPSARPECGGATARG